MRSLHNAKFSWSQKSIMQGPGVLKVHNLPLAQLECTMSETMSQLEELAEGMDIPCQLKVPSQPPEWLDKDKYYRGRIFFNDNTLSVMVSNFRNLVMGLSISNLW